MDLKYLRQFRNFYGITQAELAGLLGLSQSVISRYENGERTPRTKIKERFNKIFLDDIGLSEKELFLFEEALKIRGKNDEDN